MSTTSEFYSVNETANPAKPGGTDCKFAKIEGELLLFKNKYYKIRYVAKGTLILDTNKLMGRFGDEFPLELIK